MAEQKRAPGGALPLYLQIAELLSREIAAGIWPDGSRLPTEADLAQSLDVAVGTLRKSLAELDRRGQIERIQGSGTYVRANGRSGAIYEFFRLELNDGAGLPTARVLSLDAMELPDESPSFGTNGSRQAWRVRRLRHLGGIPAAVEEIWFDRRHAPDLHIDSILESMHLFYRENLGFWIARVEDRISMSPCPTFAPADSAFTHGTPMGHVERISWGNAGTIEEYSRNWFDPQAVRYVARWV